MHKFCGTAFVRYGSVLITMRRRALHISQHRLLCGTNILCNPVQYDTVAFFFAGDGWTRGGGHGGGRVQRVVAVGAE